MTRRHRTPPVGTTTQRGYGTEHQRARKNWMARMKDGQPCCLCGQPMYRTQALHLDHTPDRARYRGLAHAHCNEADGGRRAHRNNTPPPQAKPNPSQAW